MKILAIETSCDETAVSIIDASGSLESEDVQFSVLGDALFSQADQHAEYGGVYPNLAKREHGRNLVPMLHEALGQGFGKTKIQDTKNKQISKEKIEKIKTLLEREPELFVQLTLFLATNGKPNIDSIAVTHGPGLEPALWVGVNFARALALAWDLPIVPVNHMEGHIFSSLMKKQNHELRIKNKEAGSLREPAAPLPTAYCLLPMQFPALALLISGGHTELVLMPDWMQYKKIGQTRDDAVGEAFDKAARMLGLPYPGGPEISKLAQEARDGNLSQDFSLPRPMLKSDDLDTSFSGLKTAVLKLVEKVGKLNDETRKQIAREFEDAVADVFVGKVRSALSEHGAQTLIIGGGVAANTHIKETLSKLLKDEFSEVEMRVCKPVHATDNALMIALAGYLRAQRNEYTNPETLRANGNLSLA